MGNEYIWQGNGRTFFCTTIADKTAPTVAEVLAGTEITELVGAYTGWGSKQNYAKIPNARSTFNGQIPGTVDADDSSLSIYMDSVSNTYRAATPRGTRGFMVHVDYCPDGDPVAGNVCDVFPVQIASAPKKREMGDTAYMFEQACAITSEPAEDVQIAA